MSIFDRILRRKARDSPSGASSKPPKKTRILLWRRTDYTLKNSELIFSATSRIANSLSAMPIHLYKGPEIVNDDLSDLVSFAPNEKITSCQFFKAMEACRCTSGNAYAFKVYDHHDDLVGLELLDPTTVTPMVAEESNELWYRFKVRNGDYLYVHNYYVVHVPFISTNGYIGVNPVSVLLDTLNYSDNIQRFSQDMLEKGINAQIVLEAPSTLGDEQRKQTIADFMDTYKETGGNILLLESGVKASTLHISPVDSQRFEVEKIARSTVAMVYNIPPHLMGDYSGTSFSSQEQQTLEFQTMTMLPIVTAYEQELNKKLLTRKQRNKGYHFKFDMDAILRADASTRAEVDYKAIRSGWSTVDEVRADRGRDPLPGGIGKHALVSQDLATLDYTVNTKPDVLASKMNPAPKEPDE